MILRRYAVRTHNCDRSPDCPDCFHGTEEEYAAMLAEARGIDSATIQPWESEAPDEPNAEARNPMS